MLRRHPSERRSPPAADGQSSDRLIPPTSPPRLAPSHRSRPDSCRYARAHRGGGPAPGGDQRGGRHAHERGRRTPQERCRTCRCAEASTRQALPPRGRRGSSHTRSSRLARWSSCPADSPAAAASRWSPGGRCRTRQSRGASSCPASCSTRGQPCGAIGSPGPQTGGRCGQPHVRWRRQADLPHTECWMHRAAAASRGSWPTGVGYAYQARGPRKVVVGRSQAGQWGRWGPPGDRTPWARRRSCSCAAPVRLAVRSRPPSAASARGERRGRGCCWRNGSATSAPRRTRCLACCPGTATRRPPSRTQRSRRSSRSCRASCANW
mmetsp:Transcript_18127/g.38614  ORF Transcript_18127/g.38614 Transcript_18127/m.38614 type:complete len:322 (+) Transcript_18127:205-1170(+)